MIHTVWCSLCFKPNFLWQGYILHMEMIRNVLNFCFQPYATKVCYTLLHCAFLTDTPLTRSWKLQTKFYPMHSPLYASTLHSRLTHISYSNVLFQYIWPGLHSLPNRHHYNFQINAALNFVLCLPPMNAFSIGPAVNNQLLLTQERKLTKLELSFVCVSVIQESQYFHTEKY